MPISRQTKEELVATYVDLLNHSQGIIITEHKGMAMPNFNALRAKMREVGSTYMVTKNTLLRLALEQVGMPIREDLITGPVAVAFAHQDLGATAKAVLGFHEEVELFLVKGAMVGAMTYDDSGVDALSRLPTLDELRGSLVGLIIAPVSGLVALTGAVPQELVSVVNGGATQLLNVVAAYAAKEQAA